MSLALSQIVLPVTMQMLKGLKAVLAKSEAYCQEKGKDVDTLLQERLAADMFPFVSQVRIACDHAKGMAGRLAGGELPVHEDNETTVAELYARIDKVISYIRGLDAAAIDAGGTRQITVGKGQSWERNFDGNTYLLHFALPNFYFHLTTAYDIARNQGVPLGKTQYLGA